VGIRAFGRSMAEVFENCSLGMMSLMLDPVTVSPDRRLRLTARGSDRRSLLVSWLAEILYRVDAEGWAFGSFEISEISEVAAAGWGVGEALDPNRHVLELEIKAPTYHMLELEMSEGHWTAQVIFDV
jgi:SHS2 domain-containing protein